MVTTVAIPREYAGPTDFGNLAKGLDSREYGNGDAELDEALRAARQARSNAMMDAVAAFVEDPEQKELINMGRGTRKSVVDAPSAEETEALIKAGAGTAGIFTVIEPPDAEVYRSFLPAPLTMPEQPLVGATLLDMNPLNSKLSRFQEGRITVKAMCPDGTESWLVISTPVPTLYHTREGVVWGWPKYVADEISFTPSRAEVRYEGKVRYSLDFTPGPVDDEAALRDLGKVEGGNTVSWHWIQGGACLVRQAGTRGGEEDRVLDWQAGMVKVHIRPEDPWSRLIPENSETPGFYSKFLRGSGGDSVWQKLATVRAGEIVYP